MAKNVKETENTPKSIKEQENQKLHVQEITKENKMPVLFILYSNLFSCI